MIERSIAICGGAQHGKSTLAGRLLLESGALSEQDLDRAYERVLTGTTGAERFRKDLNRFSAPLLAGRTATHQRVSGEDSDPSRTVFPVRARLASNGSGSNAGDSTRLTLIDTPGAERFIANIVYGLYLADAAIIVVEAQASIAQSTETVCRILSAFATPVVAICVTKMDKIDPSSRERRFRELKSDIQRRLFPYIGGTEEAGTPPIVPVSAFDGFGCGRDSYSFALGLDVLELIRALGRPTPGRQALPLRFVVRGGKEIYKVPSVGTVLVGVVESGVISKNDTLLVEPTSSRTGQPVTTRVRSLQHARSATEAHGVLATKVSARAIVAANISLDFGEAEEVLARGAILCNRSDSPPVATVLRTEVVFFEKSAIVPGREYDWACLAFERRAQVVSIEAAEPETLPQSEGSRDSFRLLWAVLAFDMPVCWEEDKSLASLSRFVLREHNRIVACGRVICPVENAAAEFVHGS